MLFWDLHNNSNIMNPTKLILSAVFLAATKADAVEFPQIPFSQHDWEIACDNTRTCRAAGYQADAAERNASILLTRSAGPATTVQVEFQLAVTDEPDPKRMRMRIDAQDIGEISMKDARTTLSPAQAKALLTALPKAKHLAATADGKSWTISLKGANAVLLKMDEFQGRLETPGALVRKGSKPESSVLPPLAEPEVIAAAIASDRADPGLVPPKHRPALFAEMRRTISKDIMAENSCENLDESVSNPAKWHAYRLSDKKLLVSAECWLAAYNSGDGYWVVNAQPPYAPVFVTNLGTGYADGTIESSQRGRGIGDCMGSDSWTWDGRNFIHSASATTGKCKNIAPGGAWDLPTLAVKVKAPKQ
jgi:hypothetical protein